MNPVIRKMPFGKYKGLPLSDSEIPTNYLEWLEEELLTNRAQDRNDNLMKWIHEELVRRNKNGI